LRRTQTIHFSTTVLCHRILLSLIYKEFRNNCPLSTPSFSSDKHSVPRSHVFRTCCLCRPYLFFSTTTFVPLQFFSYLFIKNSYIIFNAIILFCRCACCTTGLYPDMCPVSTIITAPFVFPQINCIQLVECRGGTSVPPPDTQQNLGG
jgi:hypothetical protein